MVMALKNNFWKIVIRNSEEFGGVELEILRNNEFFHGELLRGKEAMYLGEERGAMYEQTYLFLKGELGEKQELTLRKRRAVYKVLSLLPDDYSNGVGGLVKAFVLGYKASMLIDAVDRMEDEARGK